jgi:MFS superfamily sulfate permease-like transporter
VYRFGVGLFYANAARFADEVHALVDGASRPLWFVLLAEAIDDIDYTAGTALADLADELAGQGVVFAIAGAGPEVRRQLDRFGVTGKIGDDHVYESVDSALAAFRARQPR